MKSGDATREWTLRDRSFHQFAWRYRHREPFLRGRHPCRYGLGTECHKHCPCECIAFNSIFMTTTLVGLFILIVLLTGIGIALFLIALTSKNRRPDRLQQNPQDHFGSSGFSSHDSGGFSQNDSSSHSPAQHSHSDWGGHSHHDSGGHSHSDSGGFGDSGGGSGDSGGGSDGGGGGGGD